MARPASDIRERLIVAARARFLLEGVDGAALRQIAKDAGTNIGMVYYYFKTKDELFLAVVQDVYGGLLTDIDRAFGGEGSEEERFGALYQRLSRLSDAEFAVVRLVLREALVSSTRLAELGQLFFRGHIPIVMRCLVEGIAQQRLRSDLSPILLLVSSLVLGFMPQVAQRLVLSSQALPPALQQQVPKPEEVARGLASILMHGIKYSERSD
ncbi:MAG: hypothetical protein RL701_7967 [Pseudomonadota bacterium]